MLSLLRELCTWFALVRIGSCLPPKETRVGGGALDKVNKYLVSKK